MCTTITCAFESTALSLWKGLEFAADKTASTCLSAAKQAGDAVLYGYTWAGRKVEKLASDALPETAAKVVASTVWAIPYTAVALAAPVFVSDIATGLALGLWQTCPREIDEGMGKNHRQHAFTGLRNASIIRAGVDAVKLAVTGNWYLLLPIISNVFFALQTNAIIGMETPEKKFIPDTPPGSPSLEPLAN